MDARSVAAARGTLARFPAATVLSVSAYDIAYEDEFAIVFPTGVIHHLECPGKARDRMVKAVKPGGLVLIWVYGQENNEWIVKLCRPCGGSC
jgi:2-polyprenyl-3-methyl-5-hydroxy-6-metoxy-1,4-benzoquinol methylase